MVEGIEAGTRLFLIDEDTSATNFMGDVHRAVTVHHQDMVRDVEEGPGAACHQNGGDPRFFIQVPCPLQEGRDGLLVPADHLLHELVPHHEVGGGGVLVNQEKPGARFNPLHHRGRGWDGRELETKNIGYGAGDAESGSFTVAESRGAGGGRGYRGSEGRGNGADGRGYGSGEDRGHGGRGRGGNRGGDGRHEHMKTKSFGLESFSMDREEVNVRYLEQLLDSEQVNALAHLLRYGLEDLGFPEGREHPVEGGHRETRCLHPGRGMPLAQPFHPLRDVHRAVTVHHQDMVRDVEEGRCGRRPGV